MHERRRAAAAELNGAAPRGASRFAVAPLLACILLSACGGGASGTPTQGTAAGTPTQGTASGTPTQGTAAGTPTQGTAAGTPAPRRRAGRLLDWPMFGGDPQRSDASARSTGITAANVSHLRHVHVALPGTVDSSPIYLHGVVVAGRRRNAIFATTTYGRTVAIDAANGRILWTFTPRGYSRWAGSSQITTASPVAGPSHHYIYASSPNGEIHKLSIVSGREAAGARWPVAITRDPTHEKIAAALNIDGRYVVAVTGGYYGDIPPYQGHVVLLDRASGRIAAVFNTLCAGRRRLIVPSSCPASDSAIWARAGAVVEPGGRRILVASGNGPWNGRSDFGDSVLQLSVPGLHLLQAYAPADQERLNLSDTDLGSSSPALLGSGRALIAGKDGVIRLLSLSRLDGHPPPRPHGRPFRGRLGGSLQKLALAGGGELISTPAVWRQGKASFVFFGGEHATSAYAFRDGRLHLRWVSAIPGTSPVLAGGLLYVYDPVHGGIEVYRPSSPHPIARLPGAPGHWNSPIVVDGHIVEPEGNANAHETRGSLEIFSVR